MSHAESVHTVDVLEAEAAFLRFRNTLAILHNIDRADLANAGVHFSDHAFSDFAQAPLRTLLRMDDTRARKAFALVEERQPAHLKAPTRASFETEPKPFHWLYGLPDPDRLCKVLAVANLAAWGSQSIANAERSTLPPGLRCAHSVEGLCYAWVAQVLFDGKTQPEAFAMAETKATEAVEDFCEVPMPPGFRTMLETIRDKALQTARERLVSRSVIDGIRKAAGASGAMS